MNRYYYDLHLHSCLSPCADNDNTPNNLAGMGELNGLNIMALTDHNTAKNCPAFFTAAKRHGIIPVAGMELTTAEDIHVVFLFRELSSAIDFDEFVAGKRVLIKNRTDVYGDQLVTDGDDNVIATDEYLLSNATAITIDDCPQLAEHFGGVCYPAHIDREANGVISVLGTFPDYVGFKCAEFRDSDNIEKYSAMYPLNGVLPVFGSDAHYLWDVGEKNAFFDLDDEPYSGAYVREKLFEKLTGGKT